MKNRIRKRVIDKLPPGEELNDSELIKLIEEEIEREGSVQYLRLDQKRKLRHEVFNSLRRMDVLQDLLDDEDVTEIMVNGHEHIFIEKQGAISETGYSFEGRERLEDIAQ